MAQDNLQRMIGLAEEFFATHEDPSQISVTGEVMQKLRRIHPATMSEETTERGPIAWVLLVPTTEGLMGRFLKKEISERELLDATVPGATYDCIYLCSALVLPEFRRRGLARTMVCRAVRAIMNDHPVHALFVWTFSGGGDALARSAARELGLPLHVRGR